jgi:hypothetical protein
MPTLTGMNASSRISGTEELLALQRAGVGFIVNKDIRPNARRSIASTANT